MSSFEVGDTVELKSGGPAMTIARLEYDLGVLRAHCQWFDGNGSVQQFFYQATSLRLCEMAAAVKQAGNQAIKDVN